MKESVRKQLPDMIKRRPQRSPFSFYLFGCDKIPFLYSLCAAMQDREVLAAGRL